MVDDVVIHKVKDRKCDYDYSIWKQCSSYQHRIHHVSKLKAWLNGTNVWACIFGQFVRWVWSRYLLQTLLSDYGMMKSKEICLGSNGPFDFINKLWYLWNNTR